MTEGGGMRGSVSSIEYLENKKNFLDEVKSIFNIYVRGIICWIKKKKKKK